MLLGRRKEGLATCLEHSVPTHLPRASDHCVSLRGGSALDTGVLVRWTSPQCESASMHLSHSRGREVPADAGALVGELS